MEINGNSSFFSSSGHVSGYQHSGTALAAPHSIGLLLAGRSYTWLRTHSPRCILGVESSQDSIHGQRATQTVSNYHYIRWQRDLLQWLQVVYTHKKYTYASICAYREREREINHIDTILQVSPTVTIFHVISCHRTVTLSGLKPDHILNSDFEA